MGVTSSDDEGGAFITAVVDDDWWCHADTTEGSPVLSILLLISTSSPQHCSRISLNSPAAIHQPHHNTYATTPNHSRNPKDGVSYQGSSEQPGSHS